MFLYMSVVVVTGLAVIWAGIADERKSRQPGETPRKQPEHKAKQNWPGGRLLQFAKPSATDSRATINCFPYTMAAEGSGKRAA